MKNVNQKEYCIIGLENVFGIKDEIISISIGSPKFIENDHMLMSVFSTYLSPVEMKDIFSVGGKSYFIFELDPKTAMVNIRDKKIHNFVFKNFVNKENVEDDSTTGLFKMMFNSTMGINVTPIDEWSEEKIRNILNNLPNFMDKDGKTDKEREEKEVKVSKQYNNEELASYSIDAKHNLINEILSKGSDLTEEDKDALKFLTNKKK